MNDLLKILDMSEDEQTEWVEDNCKLFGWQSKGSGFVPTESLADLAFRLRDEACNVENYWNGDAYLAAMCAVSEHWEGVCICDKCNSKKRKGRPMDWWADAKPIHWIIAALIAKGNK